MPSLGIEPVIDPRERELEIKTRTDGLNLSSSRRNKGVSWVCVYVRQFRLPSVTVHADDTILWYLVRMRPIWGCTYWISWLVVRGGWCTIGSFAVLYCFMYS